MPNVNQWITNWRWTGANVQTPQAQVDVRIEWQDAAGTPHSWTGTLTFPNDLQLMPIAWVREAVEDLIIRAARKRLNMDGEG